MSRHPPSKPGSVALVSLIVAMTAGCAGSAPTGWKDGGQPMIAPRARWVNGELLVDLDHQGRVMVSGRHTLTIDASGRVYDAQNEPLALLKRDGMLIGTGDTPMGWVGAGEAVLPGETHSWILLQPHGLMVRSDGEQQTPFGQWMGCEHLQTVQTCTLIAHILGRELLSKRGQRGSLGLFTQGVGLGGGFIGP